MRSPGDDEAPPKPFDWIEIIAGEERVAIVLRLICRGLDRAQIFAYARENGWKEEPLDIDHYIEVGNAELQKAAGEIDAELELGKAQKRLDFLYMEAVKSKNFKTALSIQKEINKILALKVTAGALRAPASKTEPEKARLKIVK